MKKAGLGLTIAVFTWTSVSAQVLQHEVDDGDTLYGIARRYDLSVETLTTVNGIDSPELLLPGTLLVIPNRYTVEKGDTLFSLARRFDTTVAALRDKNGLSSTTIREGQIITLPDAAVSREHRPRVAAGDDASAVRPRGDASRDAGAADGDTDRRSDATSGEEGVAVTERSAAESRGDETTAGRDPSAPQGETSSDRAADDPISV